MPQYCTLAVRGPGDVLNWCVLGDWLKMFDVILRSLLQNRRAIAPMRDKNFLDDLASRLSSALPFARELSSELRTKIEQQLARALAELDILTRAEFDAQSKALQRAERRIDELGATILQLEQRLQQFEEDSSQQ